MSPLPAIAMLLAVLSVWVPAVTPRQLLQAGDHAKLIARLHEKWMVQYGRRYKGETEKAARLQVFRQNVEFIESFNTRALATGKKYRLSINQFADLTHDEFHDMTNNRLGESGSAGAPPAGLVTSSFMHENVTEAPDGVDWWSRGAVTGIKNQRCYWVFASVATLESLVQIRTGNLVSLSEQQLMDCTNGNACTGGNAARAFEYIKNSGGLATEAYYPYRGNDTDVCSAHNTVSISSITAYQSVPPNEESALLKAVTTQPVYASIKIGSPEFRYYSQGVFYGDCSSPRPSNHAVEVIGYGTEADGTKYWLVKNSWGTTWGEGGFGKIARESAKAGPEGICSIARRTTYPVK